MLNSFLAFAAARPLAGGGLAFIAYGMIAATKYATRNYAVNSLCSHWY